QVLLQEPTAPSALWRRRSYDQGPRHRGVDRIWTYQRVGPDHTEAHPVARSPLTVSCPTPFFHHIVACRPMAAPTLNDDRPEDAVATDDRIRADLARLLQERLVHESTLGVWVHPILIAVVLALAW